MTIVSQLTQRVRSIRHLARTAGCFLSLCLVSMYAQVQVIPQVADGGGWATTIVLTNKTTSTQTASLAFQMDTAAGATVVWTPPFKESVSLSSLSLPPGATLFLHTPGTAGTLTQGWGQLTAAAGVVGYAIFTNKVTGHQDQDATAPAVPAASRILVPFDNSSGFITALAVVNPNASAETIAVNIRTTDGATTTGSVPSVPAKGHVALVLPTLLSGTTGKAGLAEFYSNSGTFSIIALRANPTGAFTAAPVYSETGAPIISSSSAPVSLIHTASFAMPGTSPSVNAVTSSVQVIPQVADGAGWGTTIVLTNRTAGALPFTLTFNKDTTAGATAPWSPPFKEAGSLTNATLAAGSTIFLHTTATAATLTQGWGQLAADPGISGYAIFTNKVAGHQDQDATAPAVTPAGRVLAPFDNSSGLITALAVVVPGASAETISVNIRNSDGTTSTGTVPSIPANGQVALVMPTLLPGTTGKAGLAEFYVSSGTIALIALRANPTGAFTAAPVYFETGSPIISTGGGGNPGGGGGTSSDTNPTQTEINAWIARGSYTGGVLTLTRSTSYVTTDSFGGGGVTPATTITKTDDFTAQFSRTSGADLGKLLTNQLPPGFPNLSPTPGSCVVYTLALLTNPYPNITSVGLDAGPQLTSAGPNGTVLAPRKSIQVLGFTYNADNVPNTYLSPGHYTLSGPGGADVGTFSGGLDIVQDLVVTNPDDFKVINRSGGVTVHWTGGAPSTILTISGSSFIIDLNNPTAINGAGFVCIQNTSAGQFTVPGSILSQLPASPTISAGGFNLITRGTFSVTAGGKGVRFTGVQGLDILTADNFWAWSFTPQYQ